MSSKFFLLASIRYSGAGVLHLLWSGPGDIVISDIISLQHTYDALP